jgi:hypothetical protein
VNLYPKDGYFFKEQDGTNLRAGNWPLVIRKVVDYRRQARLAPGDPVTEVIAQACQRNPSYCYESNRAAVPAPRVTLKATVLKWRRCQKTNSVSFRQPNLNSGPIFVRPVR